ncbi:MULTISPECIES: hypothetical protein [Brevibacillus]|uniref:hypothetical protein n=1 Tax=Brevibacillus TaxID=55080 RepID=UPI001EE54E56|nr:MULTISPECIES: hypothetical protein [Brevibacillus]MCG5254781.1 hypothetical protein [Brevibacillus agri]WNF05490.1 hypothetical protein RFB14_24705 [Brevibacillus borstelensis]
MKQVELRNEKQFRTYLSENIENSGVISDCISRCRRVQKHEGDLAEHYSKDQGRTLLDKLSYTLEEANQGIHPKHSITITGSKGFRSLYEGTQSLNHAVKRYFEYISYRQKTGLYN